MKKKGIKYVTDLVLSLLLISSSALAADFTDNGSGTVSDNDTGLTWQKEDNGSTLNWDGALKYCEDLSLANQNDWRLPNIQELESIVDASSFNPAVNTTYFPGTRSSYYWSSTYFMGHAYTCYVNFKSGNTYYISKIWYNYVRCVRGGQ